jgi:hypothetical protein
MAVWSVKPQWKKSIIERQHWSKDDDRLVVETGWRWGEFHVTTEDDNPPDLKPGVDIYNCEYDAELYETTDGCWEEHDMDECSGETQEFLEEFLEENSVFDLEEHGWTCDDTEMIIDCEMDIEMIEPTDGEEPKDGETVAPKASWPF